MQSEEARFTFPTYLAEHVWNLTRGTSSDHPGPE